jgi:dTDP-4-dehydrorhamnose reductase
MKILVLGSTGALGTAMEQVCTGKNIEYKGLSHQDFEITNKNQLETIINNYNPSVVLNAVAIIGVNPCESDPQKAFEVHSIAVSNLAKICLEKDITLIQPSTHAVFDGNKESFYTEEDIPNPLGVYGISKLAAEFFTLNKTTKHYVVRFPTMFGSRRNKSLGFVDKMIGFINQGKEIRVAEDKIDSPTYTLDAAHQLVSILENKEPFGIYHIANFGSVNYYDFISKLAEKIGYDKKVIRAKERDFQTLAHNPLKTSMKSVKLPPMRSWQDALEEYIKPKLKTNQD